MGVARAVGAIAFGIVIGLVMRRLFRDDEARRLEAFKSPPTGASRPLWQTAAFFGSMVAILVFANGAYPAKWFLTAAAAALLAFILVAWLGIAWRRVLAVAVPTAVLAAVHPVLAFGFASVGLAVAAGTQKGEPAEWIGATWALARQILPLLLAGILLAGALLGRPGHEGLIPSAWVAGAVGGNSLGANLFAAVAGAFMYFATLTEIPILQGLMGSGMGHGPALALLLAGPALSLPSILVLRSIMGTRKTLAYLALVVAMAAAAGKLYGEFVAWGGLRAFL
jgi:uncharacterized protein